MKNKCPIVLDLLPLAAEKLLRDETSAFVAEHIASCEDCRQAYEEIMSSPSPSPENAAAPLHALHKKLVRARVFTALCAAFIAAAVAFALYIAAAQPHYYPYSKGLFTMTEYPDGSVEITFGPEITYNSATHTLWSENGREILIYEIQAGYTIMDRLRPSGVYSSTIRLAPYEDMPMAVFYTQNNGRENVCIYGQEHINGGVQTLARLTLGYYFIIACVLVIILAVLTALIKKARPVLEKILLVPASYLLGHIFVMGLRMTTYDIEREFISILWVSILVFCALLCALFALRMYKKSRPAREIL